MLREATEGHKSGCLLLWVQSRWSRLGNSRKSGSNSAFLENFELQDSDDFVMRETLGQKKITKWGQVPKINGKLVRCRDDVVESMNVRMIESVDGKGLKGAENAGFVNEWICDGSRLMTGHDFVDTFRLKHSLLYTKVRSKRMFKVREVGCDMVGCGALAHILQVCPRTHAARISRHNSVVDLIGAELKKSWAVMVELHVRTRSGVLIPDIVVHRDNSAWIIDVAISADNDVNDSRYNQKVQHYSGDDLKVEVSSITMCSKIQVGAVVFNWRGKPCFPLKGYIRFEN